MSSIDPSEAGQQLIDHVLKPLVLGGTIVPLDHVDESKAADIVRAAMQLFTPSSAAQVDLVRVRVARRLAPVDTAPAIDSNTWALLLAFSNLLRGTDPENDSIFSPGKSLSIMDSAEQLIENARPVNSALDALGRHTVFYQVLRVRRLDAKVSWWCGSESFAGREPPHRLLAWPDLRHVHVARDENELVDVSDDPSRSKITNGFLSGLGKLLVLSPLTDIANIMRSTPTFACSDAVLQLLADPLGQLLALRALRHVGPQQAIEKLRHGCGSRSIAPHFATMLRDVDNQLQQWARL